jgi:hypothetical protein
MDLWFFHIRPSAQSFWFPIAGIVIALCAGAVVLLLTGREK